MRNKRFINSSRHILLTALAAIGVALFVFFQVSDRDNLKHTVDECISFAKLRITNMEKFNTNDQVKSLVRLLDKSIELGHDMTDWEVIDGQQLDSYAEAQRLSGVLVLDEKLETVLKTTADADSVALWSELIHAASVGDIVTHTQKTYTTRITIDGNIYDFAAVAREDAPGLIITYVQKDQVNGTHGDLTIDSLFTIEKLKYFNAHYIREMSPADFAKAAEPYIRQAVKNESYSVAKIAAILQNRCEKLTDIPEKLDFFDELPEYDIECYTNKKSKTNAEVSLSMLNAALPRLEALDTWNEDSIKDTLTRLAEELGCKNATVMWPVRIAASGRLVTPGGVVEICDILGKEETIARVKKGIAKLES